MQQAAPVKISVRCLVNECICYKPLSFIYPHPHTIAAQPDLCSNPVQHLLLTSCQPQQIYIFLKSLITPFSMHHHA